MARKSTQGQIGSKVQIPSEHKFADPEEIAGRDKQGSQPAATAFKQIDPSDTGMNMANPKATDRSSTFKFSKGNV